MNDVDLKRMFDEQMAMCHKVMHEKAAQYTEEGDRLANFKIAAALQECSQGQALGGMMAKHVVSVYSLIKSDDCDDMAVWNEKLTDTINYLILLRGVVCEELTSDE